jgi:lipoyl(octanoyl) transferase
MDDPAGGDVAARPLVRRLGRVDYVSTVTAMRAFTDARTAGDGGDDRPDEIWLCEHPPVYTQGLAGRPEHVLNPQGAIPVVQTDRGGQVTYHGPGQVVAYPLVDLRRLGIYVKEYVFRIEQAVLKTLEALGVTGHRVAGAPGIYVDLAAPFGHARLGRYGAKAAAPDAPASATPPDFTGLGKIAAIGVKVSRHCTYHGVALNVAMDLSPFDGIDPCGYAGLRTVDLSTIGVRVPWDEAALALGAKLATYLTP